MSVPVLTTNPEITNINSAVVELGNNEYRQVTIASGQDLLAGTVLGKITSSGKYVAVDSTATDGSQLARMILSADCDATDADTFAMAIITGDVDAGLLLFQNADSLDTVPASPSGQPDSYLDQLRDYTIFAITTDQLYIEDNQ
jgi:hypothetical protein